MNKTLYSLSLICIAFLCNAGTNSLNLNTLQEKFETNERNTLDNYFHNSHLNNAYLKEASNKNYTSQRMFYSGDTIAEHDINQIPQNETLNGNVLENDYGNFGNPMTLLRVEYFDDMGNRENIIFGMPTIVYDEENNQAGEITFYENGVYNFTPLSNYVGKVSFTYFVPNINFSPTTDNATLNINVIPVPNEQNNVPIAHNDKVTILPGSSITISILENDNHIEGEEVRIKPNSVTWINSNQDEIILTETPQTIFSEGGYNLGNASVDEINGTITFQSSLGGFIFDPITGEVYYDPNLTTIGNAKLNYEILDQSNPGSVVNDSDKANLFIRVISNETFNGTYAIDDANVGLLNQVQSGNVVVNDINYSTDAQFISFVDSNADGIPNTEPGNLVTLQSGGTILFDSSGTYTYTPFEDFVGTEQVVYQVVDGDGYTSNGILYLTTFNSSVLPVEITSFTVDNSSLDSELNWSTDSENNNSHFIVQRSIDGYNFENIKRVEGSGTTNEKKVYSYIDENAGLLANTIYYRLVQVDYDGTNVSSEMVLITFESQRITKVYPNPANIGDNITVEGNNISTVELYSISGQLVKSYNYEGRNIATINTSNLSKGMYILVVNNQKRLKVILK